MSVEQRHAAATAAANHFVNHPLFLRSQSIACYVAFRDEFDTTPLIDAIWKANKHCYLPVLTPEKILQFARYEQGDVLQKNQYGILEPQPGAPQLAVEALDLVITPLLAFDQAGHRLGTGGGYYDKTFALATERDQPHLIGLGYTSQEADRLPVEAWDIALAGVITENGLRLFNSL